ncbi:hypothetical protein HZC07_02645, partial [Candidatus Micrarchaeota archaeon]|nr:hypothetical protein [Candidatus Micrarchaeota archaeon]
MDSDKLPGFNKTAFNCPHCRVYASQMWDVLRTAYDTTFFHSALCSYCQSYSLWHSSELIYPFTTSIAPPNLDL